jgi:hypothetical protein
MKGLLPCSLWRSESYSGAETVDVARADHVIQCFERLMEKIVHEELPVVNPLLLSLHDVACCEILGKWVGHVAIPALCSDS